MVFDIVTFDEVCDSQKGKNVKSTLRKCWNKQLDTCWTDVCTLLLQIMLLSLLSLIEFILFEKILVSNIETLELEKNILQQNNLKTNKEEKKIWKHILVQTCKQRLWLFHKFYFKILFQPKGTTEMILSFKQFPVSTKLLICKPTGSG